MGVSNLKLFVSGNNLWVWSRMPDDREQILLVRVAGCLSYSETYKLRC